MPLTRYIVETIQKFASSTPSQFQTPTAAGSGYTAGLLAVPLAIVVAGSSGFPRPDDLGEFDSTDNRLLYVAPPVGITYPFCVDKRIVADLTQKHTRDSFTRAGIGRYTRSASTGQIRSILYASPPQPSSKVLSHFRVPHTDDTITRELPRLDSKKIKREKALAFREVELARREAAAKAQRDRARAVIAKRSLEIAALKIEGIDGESAGMFVGFPGKSFSANFFYRR
jgi:hypothetical protein